jgi:hypothetical protein
VKILYRAFNPVADHHRPAPRRQSCPLRSPARGNGPP